MGIRKAFDALSNELAHSDEKAELVVVGGAALVLLFGARETTKDVDVQFLKPAAAVLRDARRGWPGSLGSLRTG